MGHCCTKSTLNEEYAFNEFWGNITIRNKHHKDIEEFISLRVKNGRITDKDFNKVIEEFLLSIDKDKKKDSNYRAFWKEAWANSLVDGHNFELILSLIFLCKPNRDDFISAYESLSECMLSERKSYILKVKSILKYYFNLLTNFCSTSLVQADLITEEDLKEINSIYEDKYIDITVSNLIKSNDDSFEEKLFFIKYYDILSNDERIRSEIVKTYREYIKNN